MKKQLHNLFWFGFAWILGIIPAIAQGLSTNQVNYQLTYNPSTQVYTVWVVPQYNTPNSNNPETNELGATAQVSLKVPKDFVIQNITDIRGTWEKSPTKLGSQPEFIPASLDPNYRYYMIGKNSTETNYGAFVSGTPISLFTFQGNACYGAVGILAKTDPFVAAARSVLSLNTACSFYSRSGQATSGNVIPLEQFVDKLGPDPDCSAPSIKLIKSIASITDNAPTGRGVGDVINYTFTVTNTGNVSLSAVTLTDTKLSLSNVAVSPSTLAPGGTGTATATYTITQADVNAGGIENTATVTGTPSSGPLATVTDISDAGTDNNAVAIGNPDVTESPKLNGTTDTDPTNDPTVLLIAPAPSIKLIKSIASITDNAPTGRGVGDVINYTFTVTNMGNVTLTGVSLTDAKLSLTNAAVSPATLLPGGTGTATATYTITQADVNAGGIENTATVTGTPPNLPNGNAATPVTDVSDAGTDNNAVAISNPDVTESPKLNGTTDTDPTNDPTVLLIAPVPSIKLIKSIASITDNAPTGRGVGDVINYTFTVTNTGNVTLTGVSLTDAKLSLTNAAVSPATLLPGGTGTATATYTITQADVNAGGIENTATVTGTPPNLPNGNAATPVTDVSDAGTNNNGVAISNPDVTESPKLNGTTDTDPTNDPTVLLIAPAPSIKLIKSIASITDNAPTGRGVGDVINYTFTVTNTGNVTLSGVALTDTKLSLTNAAVSPATLLPGGTGTATATYTITLADVNAGGIENTATVTGTPPNLPNGNAATPVTDVSDAGTDNNAVAIGNPDVTESPKLNGTTDTDPTNDPTVLLIAPAPSIKLIKSIASVTDNAPTGRGVGDVINYTFTVTNTGNVTLTGVSLTDAKLSLTNAAVSPATLLPGGTGTATATYTITLADVNAGGIENTATVTGTPPNLPNGNAATPVTDVSDAGTNNNGVAIGNPDVTESPKLNGTTDTDPTNDPTVLLIAPAPSIKLIKSIASVTDNAPTGRGVGDVINYTFTVTNTGNVTLTGVALTDAKLSLTNAAVSPATLLPGGTGTATATYTITLADVNAGGIENTATVTGTPPNLPNGNAATPVTDVSDAGTDNNAVAIGNPDVTESPKLNGTTDTDPTNDPTVLVVTPAPRLRLVKLAALGGTGAVGDVITYTFTVTNTGNVTLTNLSIDDAKLSLNNLPVSPSTLAPNATGTATATYTITQADLNAGEVKNTAIVTGTPPSGPEVTDVSDSGDELVDTPADPDSDPTNDPTVVPLTQKPKIGIAKEVVSFVNNLNYTFDVTFNIKVKNFGNVPLSNVQVFDTLSKTFPSPASTNVLGVSSTKFTVNPAYTGTASNTQLLLPGNGLAISDSGSITLTVRVTPNVLVGLTYLNIAYATGQSPLGQTVEDQSQLGNNPDPDSDKDPENNSDPTPITIVPPGKLTLLPKVYLQGSLFGVFSGSLMRDDLRAKNLIPRKSPYVAWNPVTAADTITSNTVLGVTGANAIVDWVFVELRDADDSTVVVDSRSALLQRDGDIVEVDGTSPITFNTIAPADYFVSVRHRNHLGVMSQTALPLTQVVSTIDFRSAATPTYVLANSPIHQSQVDVVQGKALWAGNSLYDGQIIYQGTDNDVNVIYQQVIAATGNPLLLPFYILAGYYTGDINMDGEVIFQGTTNDVEYIYQNVINNHNGNILKQNFFIIQEQLPK
ncbi:hypothetical protein [Runella sp. SP2]|uniref:DUF7507 domain-containing protein n=1 Tax=Runella sp. SP2 TaxID=2268026 RepID=UPI000F0976B7|nr:hypothetical protein [Runella sp. SP2]AYQ31332.1 hypothetical protein DTQ70_03695 [Runella sp. SP2]